MDCFQNVCDHFLHRIPGSLGVAPCVLFLQVKSAKWGREDAVTHLEISSEVRFCFITAEKGEVATAKGDGEKKKECTTECKSRRRRDEKAPWALNYESGEGGGVSKGRRRVGEKRAMYV